MFKHTQNSSAFQHGQNSINNNKAQLGRPVAGQQRPPVHCQTEEGTSTQLNLFLSHFFSHFSESLSFSSRFFPICPPLHLSIRVKFWSSSCSCLLFSVFFLCRLFCKSICERTCLWLRKRTLQRFFFISSVPHKPGDVMNLTPHSVHLHARQCHRVATRRRCGQRGQKSFWSASSRSSGSEILGVSLRRAKNISVYICLHITWYLLYIHKHISWTNMYCFVLYITVAICTVQYIEAILNAMWHLLFKIHASGECYWWVRRGCTI